jgi:hypothetical protein
MVGTQRPQRGAQPRPRYARAGEHGRAPSWLWSKVRIWLSERTLQEQTITGDPYFRNILNCSYSKKLHTHCGDGAQICFPACPTSGANHRYSRKVAPPRWSCGPRPVVVQALERDDAIRRYREAMGEDSAHG